MFDEIDVHVDPDGLHDRELLLHILHLAREARITMGAILDAANNNAAAAQKVADYVGTLPTAQEFTDLQAANATLTADNDTLNADAAAAAPVLDAATAQLDGLVPAPPAPPAPADGAPADGGPAIDPATGQPMTGGVDPNAPVPPGGDVQTVTP